MVVCASIIPYEARLVILKRIQSIPTLSKSVALCGRLLVAVASEERRWKVTYICKIKATRYHASYSTRRTLWAGLTGKS
ncbi:hypothetical protein CYLTODRAFT_265126 [Cylindrobasidium torrendii FP15055 ss-10]|uniref:Uncharacterized protein n=1 Tax=Cylindrobasidium torrendii FP15055 ss-10 TaxID=1314674 RepID=A0A0D7BDP4_9AGAR|nr:hypothetical protein CYLTODRAFT_265126 [Cylindrobasidium torrendii FP15055 ss-10]